jgi:hypothetical protein
VLFLASTSVPLRPTTMLMPNLALIDETSYMRSRITYLKVPKREIFYRSDFPDFYTIKSSWVGDLVG